MLIAHVTEQYQRSDKNTTAAWSTCGKLEFYANQLVCFQLKYCRYTLSSFELIILQVGCFVYPETDICKSVTDFFQIFELDRLESCALRFAFRSIAVTNRSAFTVKNWCRL